ncbi:MAG: hypothetical protein QGI45_06705 [Myxococcota bacterium]|jgi:beta-lactamase superfamily II metal-dependent hydrolase|nr:hypothetical protein [Myxococcota bacterium]
MQLLSQLRRYGFFAIILTMVCCLAPAGIRYPGLPDFSDGALHIINFDVGQADALLILYKGKSFLLDAGASRFEPHKGVQRIPRRLDAFLGNRHIDYFLITHYHADHIGSPGRQKHNRDATGIYGLIERQGITIGTVLDRGFWSLGKPTSTQKQYQKNFPQWLKSGAVQKRRELRPGDSIDMGDGVDIEVIAAAGNGYLDRLQALFPTLFSDYVPSENDYSLGVKLTFGDFEFFSAGDLTGQNALRRYGPIMASYNDMESRIANTIGPVEVYRVNHHGSANSSNSCFSQVLHPQVSVISTGPNSYGHPDPTIYNRLKDYGDVWITGGADDKVRHLVAADIVGDDVEIAVEPGGKRFFVNGVVYHSKSESEEEGREKYLAGCQETLTMKGLKQDSYKKIRGRPGD